MSARLGGMLLGVKKAHLVLAAFVLAPVLYGLWRVDVIPGIWDLQHWGESVSEVARAERRAHREARMATFDGEAAGIRARLAADPDAAPVVFLGSSCVERFDLEAAFPGAWTLNRGIGDERAALLAERLALSLPAEAWPRAAGFVLYLASPDFRRLDPSAEEVVARARRVLAVLDRLAPDAPRLLVGLLPEQELGARRRAVLEAANAGLAALAAGRPDVTFLPTDREPLRDPDGQLAARLAADRLHLNATGYQVLADWIRQEGGPLALVLAP